MQILPVMDLLDGQVVRAVAGERWRYRPVRSRLVKSAEPVAVARALLYLARFRALYIADLDAITQGGSDRNFAALASICAESGRSGVSELWLDAGRAPWLASLASQARTHGISIVPVLGTETLAEGSSSQSIGNSPDADDAVLSLDFCLGKFIGPAGLDGRAREWPSRVIVMDLAAVGVGAGPALARLDAATAVASSAGRTDIAFFAGGGVRNVNDLQALATHGAAGALVASALHDGQLNVATLKQFVGEK